MQALLHRLEPGFAGKDLELLRRFMLQIRENLLCANKGKPEV